MITFFYVMNAERKENSSQNVHKTSIKAFYNGIRFQ